MEFICIKCKTIFEHCGCDSKIKSPCDCNNAITITKSMFDNLNIDNQNKYNSCITCDLYIKRGLLNGKPNFICKALNTSNIKTCPLNLF
jgi:hypothetical protein